MSAQLGIDEISQLGHLIIIKDGGGILEVVTKRRRVITSLDNRCQVFPENHLVRNDFEPTSLRRSTPSKAIAWS